MAAHRGGNSRSAKRAARDRCSASGSIRREHGEADRRCGQGVAGRPLSVLRIGDGRRNWTLTGQSDRAPKIPRAPGPTGESRLARRAVQGRQSVSQIEKRADGQWKLVASFLIEVADCGCREPNREAQPNANSVDLEVFRNLFVSIADEMGAVLRKTAFSANIKERRDYSCAVYGKSGETIAMGDHMPVHLGAMPLSVRACAGGVSTGAGRCGDRQRPISRRNAFARHHRGIGRIHRQEQDCGFLRGNRARTMRMSVA